MPTGLSHVRALADALSTCAGRLVAEADDWGRELAQVLSRGHRLLAAGNGGSAAQAQHLTAELVGRYRDDRPPLSAIALHAETSSLTAIANDYGADDVFARQVSAHGRPGDVLVLMSTSGRSPNLLRAAESGRAGGLTVWAMTGPRPNPLAGAADRVLAVDGCSTATVQELHLVALHVVCAALDVALGVCPETRLDLRQQEGVA
jgi:phosphoheptose isomerase